MNLVIAKGQAVSFNGKTLIAGAKVPSSVKEETLKFWKDKKVIVSEEDFSKSLKQPLQSAFTEKLVEGHEKKIEDGKKSSVKKSGSAFSGKEK